MTALYGLWRLSRPLNLLILLLTLYMLNGVAYKRMYFPREFDFGMPLLWFAVFVIACLLAAAAGNIINDINDIEIDKVNRPAKKTLDVVISPKTAWRFAMGFNITGLAMALILSIKAGNPSLFALYILAIVLLYGYSSFFKPIPLVGNLVVASLVMLVIISLWLFSMAFSVNAGTWEMIPGKRIMYISLFYAGFAFFISLARELIKDMADREGDSKNNRRTLALIWPETSVKFLMLILNFILIALVFVFQKWLVAEGFGWVTAILGIVQIVLIVTILRILTAQMKTEYDKLADVFKWIMLIGIASGYFFMFN